MKLAFFCFGSMFGIGIGTLIEHTEQPKLQEYQIRLEMDSAYIYDGSRLVGSCEHGKDGIDSVIVLDNL
jgi:hypothetical protein